MALKWVLIILQIALLYALLWRRRFVIWFGCYIAAGVLVSVSYEPQNEDWWRSARDYIEPLLIGLRAAATIEAFRPLLIGAPWYRRQLIMCLLGLSTAIAWAICGMQAAPENWSELVQTARSAEIVGLAGGAIFVWLFAWGDVRLKSFRMKHAMLWTILLFEHGVLEMGWQTGWLKPWMSTRWLIADDIGYVIAVLYSLIWIREALRPPRARRAAWV